MAEPFLNPPPLTGLRAPRMNEGNDALGNIAGNDPGLMGRVAELLMKLREPASLAMMGMGGPGGQSGVSPAIAPFAIPPKGPIPRLGYERKQQWYGAGNPDPQTIRQVQSIRQQGPGLEPTENYIRGHFDPSGDRYTKGWTDFGRPGLSDRHEQFQYSAGDINEALKRARYYQTQMPLGPQTQQGNWLSLKSDAWIPPGSYKWKKGDTGYWDHPILDKLNQRGLWP